MGVERDVRELPHRARASTEHLRNDSTTMSEDCDTDHADQDLEAHRFPLSARARARTGNFREHLAHRAPRATRGVSDATLFLPHPTGPRFEVMPCGRSDGPLAYASRGRPAAPDRSQEQDLIERR